MTRAKNGHVPVRRPRDPNSTVLGVFLDEHGKLPAFAQRRLDYLIFKKKEEGLTREEARELRAALEYVEEKSIELLAHAASLGKAGRDTRAEHRPLWQRYLEARARQLLIR